MLDGSPAVPDDSIKHPSRAVADLEVKPVDRSDHADLITQDLVARRTRLDQDALLTVADDDVVVLGIGSPDGRVCRAEHDPLLGVARRPTSIDRVRTPDRAAPVWGSTG